jgi:antitoxin VapB
MPQIAKIFMHEGYQAVCLPEDCRFDAAEVFIRRDPTSEDVVLSCRPPDWDAFFRILEQVEVPADFLSAQERQVGIVDPVSGAHCGFDLFPESVSPPVSPTCRHPRECEDLQQPTGGS